MYKVLEMFDDLTDAVYTKSGLIYHRYEKGDAYPREGQKPDAARIEELSGPNNARGVPLIREVKARTSAKKE